MHSLDRVNMAWDRQRQCNIRSEVIGACPRFEPCSLPWGPLVKCLAATTCPTLKSSACPGLTVTECSDCPLDERPPQPCGQVTASGGQGTTKTRHGLGPTAGLVRITYDMYSIPDRLDCFYKGVLVGLDWQAGVGVRRRCSGPTVRSQLTRRGACW